MGFVSLFVPRIAGFHASRRLTSASRQCLQTSTYSIRARAETSTEEVKRIAKLARLELSDDEIAKMTPEFQKVIGFFEEMNEVDVSEVDPMYSPIDAKNIMRDDSPARFTEV